MTSSENFVIEDLGVSEGEVEPLDLVNVGGLIKTTTPSQRYLDQVETEKAQKLREDASSLIDFLKANPAATEGLWQMPASGWRRQAEDVGAMVRREMEAYRRAYMQTPVPTPSLTMKNVEALTKAHAKAYPPAPKVEPAVKLPLSELADVIDEAANLLETDGWIQGTFSNAQGRCAVGGIRTAAGLHLIKAYGITPFGGAPSHREAWLLAVREAQAKVIDLMGLDLQVDTWNDTKGRTADEVIALLRDAARFIRKEIA